MKRIDIQKFINKELSNIYLEIYFILDEISRKENIISFSYKSPYLMVQIGKNDYYRINLKEVKKC